MTINEFERECILKEARYHVLRTRHFLYEKGVMGEKAWNDCEGIIREMETDMSSLLSALAEKDYDEDDRREKSSKIEILKKEEEEGTIEVTVRNWEGETKYLVASWGEEFGLYVLPESVFVAGDIIDCEEAFAPSWYEDDYHGHWNGMGYVLNRLFDARKSPYFEIFLDMVFEYARNML